MHTEEIEAISEISKIEMIAVGNSIRVLERRQKKARWRSLEKVERPGKGSPAR